MSDGQYTLGGDGIYLPATPVRHRGDEYGEDGFDMLLQMQERHFW